MVLSLSVLSALVSLILLKDLFFGKGEHLAFSFETK